MDPKDTPTQNVKIECRDIGDEEIWGNVERECQRGLVIGGLSCDRWGAQRRLSCTIIDIELCILWKESR